MKLPLNCTIEYVEDFLSAELAEHTQRCLLDNFQLADLNRKNENQRYAAEGIRKVMFMDQDIHEANKLPSKIWGETSIWSAELLAVKKLVEEQAKTTFQVCVCLYYPDGQTGVAYHADLPAYGDTTTIASISLGEERVFLLREKGQTEELEVLLKHGSLLLMGEHSQERYEHSLPINSKYKKGRINLTFRQFGYPDR